MQCYEEGAICVQVVQAPSDNSDHIRVPCCCYTSFFILSQCYAHHTIICHMLCIISCTSCCVGMVAGTRAAPNGYPLPCLGPLIPMIPMYGWFSWPVIWHDGFEDWLTITEEQPPTSMWLGKPLIDTYCKLQSLCKWSLRSSPPLLAWMHWMVPNLNNETSCDPHFVVNSCIQFKLGAISTFVFIWNTNSMLVFMLHHVFLLKESTNLL